MSKAMPTILIVPTGIGCSVGGFAGDAIPTARLLSAATGSLITHPNVMNGASLYWSDSQIQYVEGLALDMFATGKISLRPVRQQKVGILLDCALEEDLRVRHIQVADSCQATLGLDIGPIVLTDEPVKITLHEGISGSSWGDIGNPDALIVAAKRLKGLGATAIAVVTRFPDDDNSIDLQDYRKGSGVDALSGAEAVISHLIMKYCCIPCAHAPALLPLPIEKNLDPRAASEEIGYTFLPSVLVGLSRAPDLIPLNIDERQDRTSNVSQLSDVDISQVGALVVPDSAFGGETVLACLERNIPIISVSNPGVLSLDGKALGLKNEINFHHCVNLINASNYVEAAGILLSLREGINLASLRRPIDPLACN